MVAGIGGVAGLWYGYESGRDLQRFALAAGFEERFNGLLMSERMMGDMASYRKSLRKYLSQLKARRGTIGPLVWGIRKADPLAA
jgi:ABC-type Fe3+/spermidine/putrescine transport system ATPase subunit